jgi:hypothetical protein
VQATLWQSSQCTGESVQNTISDTCGTHGGRPFTSLEGPIRLSSGTCMTESASPNQQAPCPDHDVQSGGNCTNFSAAANCTLPLVEYAPGVCGTVPNAFWKPLLISGGTINVGVTYGLTSTRGQQIGQSQSNSSDEAFSWAQSASTQVSQGFSTSAGGGFSFFGIKGSVSVTSSSTNTASEGHSTARIVNNDFTAAVTSMFSSSFSATKVRPLPSSVDCH